MAKKISSLVRKILSEVGRNEMLAWELFSNNCEEDLFQCQFSFNFCV